MKKVGIIIDNYHLSYKVTDFLEYLRSLAEVNLYIEESYLLKSSELYFDEDIFFVKGSPSSLGERLENIVKDSELKTKVSKWAKEVSRKNSWGNVGLQTIALYTQLKNKSLLKE